MKIICTLLFLQLCGFNVSAQSLQGTWSLVAVENQNADGTKTYPYGTNPVGLLVFDTGGRYAMQILKAERPRVAANDKNKATPEENAALVQGNNSHFGKVDVDEKAHVITFHIEHAFYPNWEGTIQSRSYTLEGDTFQYLGATTSGGTTIAKVVWKRVQ